MLLVIIISPSPQALLTRHEHMRVPIRKLLSDSINSRFHANEVLNSVYAPLVEKLSSSSKYTFHNLHCINTLRHSILCRDVFQLLSAGCNDLVHSNNDLQGWSVVIGDNEIFFSIDSSFTIRIKLHYSNTAIYDEEEFTRIINEKYYDCWIVFSIVPLPPSHNLLLPPCHCPIISSRC